VRKEIKVRLDLRILASLLAAATSLAAMSPPGGQAVAASHVVQAVEPSGDFHSWTFQPNTLTVAVGETVVWTNAGHANHTVTANDKPFDSGNLAPGQSFSWTASQPGTYAYFCSYHPWMTGTVTVIAASTAGATRPQPSASQPAAAQPASQKPSALPNTGGDPTLPPLGLAAAGLVLLALGTLILHHAGQRHF